MRPAMLVRVRSDLGLGRPGQTCHVVTTMVGISIWPKPTRGRVPLAHTSNVRILSRAQQVEAQPVLAILDSRPVVHVKKGQNRLRDQLVQGTVKYFPNYTN